MSLLCSSILKHPTKIDLSDDQDLVYYLKLYLKIRPTLLCGNDNDFFFWNRHGRSFDSSAAIAKYFNDIFEREVSIQASTTALRHAIITYFSTLNESKDGSIRQSLALLMKHSVRYQETVYNDQTNAEKVKPAREFIRKKIAASIFGHDSDSEQGGEQDSSEENSDGEFDLKPCQGDIVALLDPISDKDNIEFFLAKVARYSHDQSEVHLIHLERLENEENMFGLDWVNQIVDISFRLRLESNH